MKKRSPGLLFLFFAFTIFSCQKESAPDSIPGYLYGSWQSSYGDTIVFSRKEGTDVATYNNTMNPLMPQKDDHICTYRDGKLGIMSALYIPPGQGYHFFSTFRWIQPERSFEIQGIQWFPFLNSTGTYFTFTKIP